MFAWIRKRVASAVLNGFSDALETLEAGQHASHTEPLPLPEPLRLRLAESEPEEDAPKVKRAR